MTCAYRQCRSTKHTGPLFRFPKEKDRALIWANRCDRPDIEEMVFNEDMVHVNGKRLCPFHFERPCFVNDLKKRLNRLALPTIFQGKQQLSKYTMHNFKRENIEDDNTELNKNHATSLSTLTALLEEDIDLVVTDSSQQCFADVDNPSQIFTNETVISERLHSDMLGVGVPIKKETTIFIAEESVGNEMTEDLFSTYVKDSTLPACIRSTVPSENMSSVEPPTLNDIWSISVGFGRQCDTKKLICRLCSEVVPKECTINLFGKVSKSKEFVRKIRQLLPSWKAPHEEDDLPNWICFTCCEMLNYCNKAIWKFTTAYMKLTHMPFADPNKCQEPENVSSDNTRETQAVGEGSLEGDAQDKPSMNEEVSQEAPFEKQLFHLFESIVAHNKQSAGDNDQGMEPHKNIPFTQRGQRKRKVTNSKCNDNLLEMTCLHCRCSFSDKQSAFRHKLSKHRLHIVAQTSKWTYEFHCRKNRRSRPAVEDLDMFCREKVQQENVAVGKRQSHEINDNFKLSIYSAPSCKLIKIEHCDDMKNSKESNKTVLNNNNNNNNNNIINESSNSNEVQTLNRCTITNEHSYFNSNV